MSTLFPTRSRQVCPAGVFFGLLLLMASARAAEVDDVCVTGFPLPQKPPQNVALDVIDIQSEAMQPRIHPDLRRWMTEHSWQQGYSAWQQSRRCGSVLRASRVCDVVNAPFPIEKKCGAEIDGYHFLVMHRYLLQTFKTLWPQLDAQFSTWKKWPGIEDYPEGVRQQVGAWSDAILRAASDVNAISKANSAEVLRRWPSEGAFGQWLQCGASEGLGVDALYPALLTNAIDIPNDGSLTRPHLMDLYLFWQVHSWVDRAWEKYRRATGKMPETSASLSLNWKLSRSPGKITASATGSQSPPSQIGAALPGSACSAQAASVMS